jgi:hypothetical protein
LQQQPIKNQTLLCTLLLFFPFAIFPTSPLFPSFLSSSLYIVLFFVPPVSLSKKNSQEITSSTKKEKGKKKKEKRKKKKEKRKKKKEKRKKKIYSYPPSLYPSFPLPFSILRNVFICCCFFRLPRRCSLPFRISTFALKEEFAAITKSAKLIPVTPEFVVCMV